MMNNLGFYIHIPFCNQICSYCDFTKRVSNIEFKKKYIEKLKEEIHYYKEHLKFVDTIYIGGGTPGSLPHELLEDLLKFIKDNFIIENIKEFTIEINPEDLNHSLTSLLYTYNVNRVSIGIQTLDSKILNIMNRKIDIDKFTIEYNYLRKYINNVNFDLIYAFPNQNLDILKDTINKVLLLNPTHISLYSLILEPKTVLYNKIKSNELSLIDEALEIEMVDMIHNLLFPRYIQYEVSNYCIEGYESLHNIKYWLNEEYIGVGISSAGYLNNQRYTNINDLKTYLNTTNYISEVENLNLVETKKYHLILGFRLLEGIDILEYKKRYQSDIFFDFKILKKFLKEDYLILNNNKLKINKRYLYVMNHLLEQIV